MACRPVTLFELYLYEVYIKEGMDPALASVKAREVAIAFEKDRDRES